ncbi:MAG: bifunctional (p)ppGpp synthetase/guanosine-3',5'-bis(diphosphate) 3'-pyrophosphohydrolase, partial [Bacteroidia bacterium]
PIEFLDEFKMNLFSSEIMVFTPKGTLVSLPKGASALDFAYDIHTEIGNRAIGAKINYKLNPISAVLMSGDQVEIITSDIAKPEKEWLSFVLTSKAKEAIKNALKTESTNRIQKGMEILEMKLDELGLTPNTEIVRKLMQSYDVPNKDELYSGIELGTINLENIKRIIRKSPAKNVIKYWELKLLGSKKDRKEEEEEIRIDNISPASPFLLRENVENAEQSYEIAKCCNPIPGDEVIGYRSPEGSIIIHKPKCPLAIRIMSNEGNRIIAVRWAIHKLVSFLARISMTGVDRIGLVNDLTNIISSELKVNMTNINISVRDGIFDGTIDLYVHHTQDLNNLILKISNVRGIESIKRVEDFSE